MTSVLIGLFVFLLILAALSVVPLKLSPLFLLLLPVLYYAVFNSFLMRLTPKIITTDLLVASDAVVEKAVFYGCRKCGWVPEKVADAEITAVSDNKGRRAAVKISYGKNGYTIEYKSSNNMQYNADTNTISPKYNAWVAKLNKSIRASVDYSN